MMRGDGRVRSFNFAAAIPRVVCIFACLELTAAGSEYGIPIEIKLWDTGRTPLSHMVDVTNEFGIKVLAEHNFLNDNNIAFSPYGLMGIMVALYEGVDGESSYQVQRAMQLPWNRNVMRIGFRDIHRTLKTYFVPEEGFLAGLALNNENVTFSAQYKKVLRFYGFDLENDQLPTLSPETNNTSNGTTPEMTTISAVSPGDATTAAMTTESTPAREVTTIPSTKEETTATAMPSTNPNAETISTNDMSGGGLTSTTASPSLAPNAEDTPDSSTITTTEQVTSERISETTTQIPSSLETEPTMTTIVSIATTAASSIVDTTAVASTTTSDTTVTQTTTDDQTTAKVTSTTTSEATTPTDAETFSQSSQITSALTSESTFNSEIGTSTMETNTVQPFTQEMTSETASSTFLDSSSVTSTSSTVTSETQQTEQMSTMESLTTVPNSATTTVNESTLETLERRKKSIVDFIFTNPPYVDDYLYYRSFDIGAEVPNPNPDKMFMANGLRSVQVTYMHYDTVLEHAYLPHLEASALRLPLDSDRYYLLVILPTRGGAAELGRLLARMARESDLSDVYSVLRPRRVKGIVPSFIVKGHVTLTTDLQKLGIRAVFEPRQRDFTPMTLQTGVYVRSIEQAVSVAIRKYQPDDHKKNRYVVIREPVVFSATYPFLYFVMDANIHVALMAGKMVDPLNSRIL